MAVPTPEVLRPSLGSGRPHRPRRTRQDVGELLFIAPAAALICLAVLLPTVNGLYHGFTDWQPGFASPWVGLENFRALFGSQVFRQIVYNEFFLLLGLPLWVGAPLLLTFLLDRGVPQAGVFRTIFFFPSVLSPVIVGILFTFLLGTGGALNEALASLGLESLQRDWLTDEALVKPVIIVVLLWAGVGTGVVIFSASLSTLPREQMEAAAIDGAGWAAQLRYVMLPHLLPVIGVYALLQVINVFLWSFAWIYVLTAGGPGYSSTTLDYHIYSNALSFGNFGEAAAEGVVLLSLVAAVVLIPSAGLRLRRALARPRRV